MRLLLLESDMSVDLMLCYLPFSPESQVVSIVSFGDEIRFRLL